jgi:transposase-like protein
MAKTRPPYSPEFRRQIVDLVRAGRDPDDLAREFEPTAQSIRHWVASLEAAAMAPSRSCRNLAKTSLSPQP